MDSQASLPSPHFLEFLVDALLGSPFPALPDLPSALQLALSRRSDADKVELLQRLRGFGSQLEDAASHLSRQHDSFCNSLTWPLTYDLTIKVFSLLDARSLCQVAVSCSLFRKAAMEPACYRDINLAYHQIDDGIVAKNIQHASQHLRSLKLGSPLCQEKGDRFLEKVQRDSWISKSLLTKTCLCPLIADNGAAGSLLQALHLHNIDALDSKNLCKAIAVCRGLLDLEIVGLRVNMRKVLHKVTSCCHDLTRLSIQFPIELTSDWPSYNMRTSSCHEVVHGCPKLSTLILQGFKISDEKVLLMLKGLHHLRELDLSGADMLTGLFLRDLIFIEGQQLRRLILRDCYCLKENEVESLLSFLIAGECRGLRYLDVSNGVGLALSAPRLESFSVLELAPCHRRSNISEDILVTIRKERPELDVHADFGNENWSNKCDSMSLNSSFGYSDYSDHMESNFLYGDHLDSFASSASSDSNHYSDFDDEFELDSASNYQDWNEDEDSKFYDFMDRVDGEEYASFMEDDVDDLSSLF